MEGVAVHASKSGGRFLFTVYCRGQASGKVWCSFEEVPDILKEPISILLLVFSGTIFDRVRFERRSLPEVGSIYSVTSDLACMGFENILYDRKTKTFVDTRESK